MALDHSACDHPRTPAGRRACRAAQGGTVRDDRKTPNPVIREKVRKRESERRETVRVTKADVLRERQVEVSLDVQERMGMMDRDGRGLDPASGLPTDVAGGKDARALLPMDDRCGYINCGFDRNEHTAGMSCLNMGGGQWKSNVKRDAIAFRKLYFPGCK